MACSRDNTDVGGFDALARSVGALRADGARRASLGAGGSAAAVLAALERWSGAQVSRVQSHAHTRGCGRGSLSDRRSGCDTPREAVTGAAVVVNASPSGLRADDPFPWRSRTSASRCRRSISSTGPGRPRGCKAARAHGHRRRRWRGHAARAGSARVRVVVRHCGDRGRHARRARLPPRARDCHATDRGADGREPLLDLLLPRACVVCGRLNDRGERGLACARCWNRVRYSAALRAASGADIRSARAAADGATCFPPTCAADAPSAGSIGGSGGSLVHELKYGGWHGARRANGGADGAPDVAGRRRAGTNRARGRSIGRQQATGAWIQSERARSRARLATHWHIPVWNDVLVRARATETQTRLTPEARRRNVSGAFHAITRRASAASRCASRPRRRCRHDRRHSGGVRLGAARRGRAHRELRNVRQGARAAATTANFTGVRDCHGNTCRHQRVRPHWAPGRARGEGAGTPISTSLPSTISRTRRPSRISSSTTRCTAPTRATSARPRRR